LSMGYRIVVNADDFGMDSAVNQAICCALSRGVCSSTTMLANMEGFGEAAELCRAEGLDDCVGIHLNLTEGRPLTDRIRSNRLLCDANGSLRYRRSLTPLYMASPDMRRMIHDELGAQIDRCRAEGISITHADSHSHMHEMPGLLSLIMHLLREKGIGRLRIAANIGRQSSFMKKRYRAYANNLIRKSRMDASDYFGGLQEFLDYDKTGLAMGSVVELMVHPGQVVNGRIIDVFNGAVIDDQVASAAQYGTVLTCGVRS